MEITQKEVDGIGIASEFLKNFKGKHIFAYNKDDNSSFPRHMANTFEQVAHALWLRNDQQCGIFFTVNELDQELDPGNKRTAKMIKRFRAVFLDDDVVRDSKRSDFPLVPSIIVETSKGKYHYYWLIADLEIPGSEWSSVQRSLVAKYDGDGNAKDVSRILRIPGYRHMKNGISGAFASKLIDNNGKEYEWSELSGAFGSGDSSDGEESKGSGRESNDSGSGDWGGSGKTIEEMTNEIIQGLNYHENLVNLSWQMIKDGMGVRLTAMALRGIMAGSKEAGTSRWQVRFDDIDRIVNGAKNREKQGAIDLGELKKESVLAGDRGENIIPWPPGNLGALATNAYEMAHYQYREVAIISAVGIVAGIAGRKFNVSGTGLNLYMTLIMGTGMGKDAIGKFVTGTLNRLNSTGSSSSFIGSHRYTSCKAMYNDVKDARSKICVFTEAGILMQTKSGDQESILRTLLGWYSKSGRNDWTGSESYSSSENSIPSMNAVSLSIISEATPETLLQALTSGDTLENGFLPRQSVYRVMGKRPNMNLKLRTGVDEKLMKILGVLVKKCAGIQSADAGFEVWDFAFDSDIESSVAELGNHYNDLYNAYSEKGDTLRANMATRMFLKALKFSAIASVFNHRDLVIKREEWSWGVAMAEFEFRTLEAFFSGSSYGTIELEASREVMKVCIKLLEGGYGQRFKLTKKQIENQVIPHRSLVGQVTKLAVIKRYGKLGAGYKGMTTMESAKLIIKYMVEMKYLIVTYPNSATHYSPSAMSNLLFKED